LGAAIWTLADSLRYVADGNRNHVKVVKFA
jgi:hypothetical protein